MILPNELALVSQHKDAWLLAAVTFAGSWFIALRLTTRGIRAQYEREYGRLSPAESWEYRLHREAPVRRGVAKRLREERLHTRLSLEDFAKRCGIKLVDQYLCERGHDRLEALSETYWLRAAGCGIDTCYVRTGDRVSRIRD